MACVREHANDLIAFFLIMEKTASQPHAMMTWMELSSFSFSAPIHLNHSRDNDQKRKKMMKKMTSRGYLVTTRNLTFMSGWLVQRSRGLFLWPIKGSFLVAAIFNMPVPHYSHG